MSTCLQQSFPCPLGQAGQERNLEDARGKTEQKCMKEAKGNACLLDRFSVWGKQIEREGKGALPLLFTPEILAYFFLQPEVVACTGLFSS